VAADIYDEILDFANYAFNKAHAVSYAIVAYQTAYLKYYYPCQYMAALITSVLDKTDKLAEYIAECRELGIRLLPPDINRSEDGFTIDGEDIRFGLAAVKNIGRGFIRGVIGERAQGGPFTSLYDFCERLYGPDLNKRAVECLIKSGAFDSLGAKRSQLLEVYQPVMDAIADDRCSNLEGQFDLFGGGEESRRELPMPERDEYSKTELMKMEKEVTGLYLSGHPMEDYREVSKRLRAAPIGAILASFDQEAEENGRYADGQTVNVTGIVSAVKTKTTKNNSLMAYVTVEDETGSIESLVFQRTLDEWASGIAEGTPVLLQGRISVRDEKAPQIVASALHLLTQDMQAPPPAYDRAPRREERPVPPPPPAPEAAPRGKTLYLRFPTQAHPAYEHLKLVLLMFPGQEKCVVYFADTKKQLSTRCVIHPALIAEMQEWLGAENVVVK
jgi:DNA polymerase-3 subunit alpha